MTDFLQPVFNSFWNENFWLPVNITWEEIAYDPENPTGHPNSLHLWYPIPMGLLMLIIRYALERYCFAPVGIALGVKNSKPKRAPPNPVLEKAYNIHKQINRNVVEGLSKQLDWTERQVEKWLVLRKNQDQPSTLSKFSENAWSCLYYTCSFVYGMFILWDKPFLWAMSECWTDYPHQAITNDIWWYYMTAMAFNWSLIMGQFIDVKRKDFWEMFIHHIATISLMSLSWICKFYRVGTLVLVLHDCSDIFMDAAKMAKYVNSKKFYTTIFGIFIIIWIITRLGFFPFWIIYGTTIGAPKVEPMFPASYVFVSLLLLLLTLHIFWTYLIFKIAYKVLYQMEGDLRSSSNIDTDITSHWQ